MLQNLKSLPEITPRIIPGNPEIHYSCNLTQSNIDAMVALGFLVANFFNRSVVCPACRSDQLIVSEACMECSSHDISPVALFYHYTCAAVFPLKVGDRHRRQCPKCGDCIVNCADEFEECGQIYHCSACSHDSPEAITHLECRSCDWAGDANQAATIRLESFHLTEKARKFLEEQTG